MKKLLCCLGILVLLSAAAVAVPVTDGLIIHLRADDLVSLSNGDPVTTWPDSSTDAYDFTANAQTGFGTPTFVADGGTGQAAVRFERVGSTDAERQLLDSLQVVLPTAPAAVTQFVLATGGSSSNTQRSMQFGRANGGDRYQLAFEMNSTTCGVRANGGAYLVTPAPFADDEWIVASAKIGVGEAYQDLDYTVNGQYYAPTGGTLTTLAQFHNKDSLIVGCGETLSAGYLDQYDGMVSEILVYNGKLTTDQIQQVSAFLQNKHKKATAHNPSPAHKAVGQGTVVGGGNVEVTFSWTTGRDPNNISVVNPYITQHYFYLSAPNEPNFLYVTPVTVALGSGTASYGPITLPMDTIYYWRVDESVNGSAAGSSNTITGPVWSLETVLSVPVVVTQPVSQVVDAGTQATFTIGVSSVSTPSYAWYKSVDNASNTPGDDTSVGIDSATLEIPNAQSANQGYYFCKVTNLGGDALSNVVTLGIKRKVAHWTLDQADYVGGQYLDSSGEGLHADPNIQPLPAQFITGAELSKTAQGLDLTPEPLAAAKTASTATALFTGEATVSAWVNWAGSNSKWQGIASNRSGTSFNYSFEIRNNNGNLQINAPYFTELQAPVNLPIGEWAHAAVTIGQSGIAMYLNGAMIAQRTGAQAVAQTPYPVYIGALSGTDELLSLLNGALDDVRIYNYAMDKFAVADLYSAVKELPVCLNPNDLAMSFDVAGGGTLGDEPDCLINLNDFAVLAAEWLNCGLYPASDCPN